MFIDYLTLMLINQSAGLAVLAGWIFLDGAETSGRRWSVGMLMSGSLALVTGLHMIFTWPLPGSFNILFGEMSVFFGILMLGLSLVLLLKLDLLPVAVYASFVGLASIVIGAQVLNLGLTKSPILSGTAFLWSGVIGLCAIPMLRLRGVQAFRILGGAGLILAALLWAITGYNAYWGHVKPFSKWKPVHLQYQIEMQKPPAQQ